MKSLLPLAIATASAWSAGLVLLPSPLECGAPVPAGPLATGKIPVELLDENEVGFSPDLRRAVASPHDPREAPVKDLLGARTWTPAFEVF